MPNVVVTAQVEDSVKWEAGFRTHGELFSPDFRFSCGALAA